MSGGATVNYAWDVAGALPVILDDGAYRYVYGLDLIAAIEDGGTEHYFLYDGLGSVTEVTEVTDDAGGAEASFRYDIFGAVRASSGSTDLEFRFTGEQLDPSGLYFLRARYYDPATGRFISRDLLEFDQRYAYAGNNPVLYVDLTGEWPSCDVCGKAARAAVDAVPLPSLAQVSDGLSIVSAVTGGAATGCTAAMFAAPVIAPGCAVAAGVSVASGVGASGIDFVRWRRGDISSAEMGWSAFSTGVAAAGWAGARVLSPAWQLAVSANTLPVDAIDGGLAARSLWRTAPPRPALWQPDLGRSRSARE